MFFVTLVHVFPPSRDSCTSPSFVPAQISPFSRRDSAIANTTPAYSTPMLSGVRPPERICFALSLRVRSGPNSCHERPPSVVAITYCDPTYTLLWSCGLMVSGKVQTKRYLSESAAQPIVACGHTSAYVAMPVFTS